MSGVTAHLEARAIPTYPVGLPEKNPLFFDKRVYQGSSGKVYPIPFIDKVYDTPVDTTYKTVTLENDFVRLVLLPEIGGRIYTGEDKTNDNYDFFYRNDVIKPALVGLAGPWISGGVEFNWPQHHRPGTFLPTDHWIEEEADGARTVWMSEHDAFNRMKGMHGVRLRPDSSLIELRVRIYNRTPLTQTFLWWANVAAAVHDDYQSFFPADVDYVADHAVRAMTTFPEASGHYYGVDYSKRPGRNDIAWYKNIPVPMSYMVCQTRFDFFGGYDFARDGGFVHVADRHIAPGKKQWTWGNHEFGWAWDRELTDNNGPYVELMAGVYTDNQPDFTYILPYETKTFSQFWWPLQNIGPVQQADQNAALRLVVEDDRTLEIGACASRALSGARILLEQGDRTLLSETVDLQPGRSWKNRSLSFSGDSPCELRLSLLDNAGDTILSYRPVDRSKLTHDRKTATEPPAPSEINSSDELYFTGEHLEQYRHATRDPEAYWREALRRDPGDVRCHIALGRRALREGRFAGAEEHFDQAIERLAFRHPNPATGEAHYFGGVAARFSKDPDKARERLNKASWNYEWRSAAHYLLACIEAHHGDHDLALEHLDQSLQTNIGNNKARTLKAVILRHRGNVDGALEVLAALLDEDPLDHWARWEKAQIDGALDTFLEVTRNDAQTVLDIAFDYADAGFFDDAAALLEAHHAAPVAPVAVPNPSERTPMTHYTLAWLRADPTSLPETPSPDRFFPSRLHEQVVLEWVLSTGQADPVAAYGYGNYLYDRKRREEAIDAWERAAREGADWGAVHRNLGIAYWNCRGNADAARTAYEKAIALDLSDARILAEFDQLRAKLNEPLQDRLAFLEERKDIVLERDDCTVALTRLRNLTGRPREALDLLTSRRFHPWEGGEGAVLGQYTTARLLLGREALEQGRPEDAYKHFIQAMDTPQSLGEAYHLLQAKANVNYWIGRSLREMGQTEKAREYFEMAAWEECDFAEMAVTAHSPLSYYRGLALRELGIEEEATSVFRNMLEFGTARLSEKANIPYFATSLPNLLVFDESLQQRRDAENHLLIALAWHGLDDPEKSREHLDKTLAFTNEDQYAADLNAALNEPTTHAAKH